MATTHLKGNPIQTSNNLPEIGSKAVPFTLTATDLSDIKLQDYAGQKIILNIFPSVDTPVCATSVRQFNQAVSTLDNTTVICISRDLPFAQARFCGAQGLENVVNASEMKRDQFGHDYGVKIMDGPLEGLFARAVIVIDETGKVIYNQLVDEITTEPDYESALKALK